MTVAAAAAERVKRRRSKVMPVISFAVEPDFSSVGVQTKLEACKVQTASCKAPTFFVAFRNVSKPDLEIDFFEGFLS